MLVKEKRPFGFELQSFLQKTSLVDEYVLFFHSNHPCRVVPHIDHDVMLRLRSTMSKSLLVRSILTRSSAHVMPSAYVSIHTSSHWVRLRQPQQPKCRYLATMADADLNKRLEQFQELFVEARLSIEECQDAAGTKYFDEEAEAATDAVADAVAAFTAILNDIRDPDQKNRVLRGNGLKIEQLKGELDMALKGGHDH